MPYVRERSAEPGRTLKRTGTILLVILAILELYGMGQDSSEGFDYRGWTSAGGDKGNSHYSELTQINRTNVHRLQLAWVYHSGDISYEREPFWDGSTIECNPIIVDGVMYSTTPTLQLVAVDAATGKEIWRFDPRGGKKGGGVNRGVAYWQAGDDRRFFFAADSYLYAVNARTGKPVTSFGERGRVLLGRGSRLEGGGVTAPAAPVIYKGLVIVGEISGSIPGNVSAYEARTGKQAWVFHNIPHPGEFGYETYGDKNFYKTGAAVNAWGGLAVDEKNALVFFSTGSPEKDFYRPFNEGAHLFGNCVVGLDARTGKRVWHYQGLHRDLWDLDLAAPPILAELEINGQRLPGLIQLSKTGNIFLFNRLTGEAFSKVEERPAPPSTLYGEKAYPTQPYVLWPQAYSRQFTVTEQDLTNLSPQAHAYALQRFKRADTGWFVPPSEPGILYYGIHGGAEWPGGAFDPTTQYVYINANEIAWYVQMTQAEKVKEAGHPGFVVYQNNRCVKCHGARGEGVGGRNPLRNMRGKYDKHQIIQVIRNGIGSMPSFPAIPYEDVEELAEYLLGMEGAARTPKKSRTKQRYVMTAFEKFVDPEGYPATKPPWGTLNAIDLRSGKIAWSVPLGEHEELRKRGIPQTGTENFGGPVVTKGSLVFIAATQDEKIRAFDKDTGRLLWEAKLPFAGHTTPSTYEVNGRQYLVIPCGGGGKLGTKPGDTFVAFVLPESGGNSKAGAWFVLGLVALLGLAAATASIRKGQAARQA